MYSFDQVPVEVYCPRCRTQLQPNRSYCSSCGLWVAPLLPGTSNQVSQPSFGQGSNNNRSQRLRSMVLYCTCALLSVLAIATSALYFTGISPLSLFSSKEPDRKVIAYPLPKGAPLFADSFSDDTYGWNLQSSPGNYSVTLGNSSLGLQVEKQNVLWELLPGERTFSNFTLSVHAALSHGDQNNGYGVYIRGTSDQKTDLATYYRFELYGDGSYAIFKGTRDAAGNSITTKMVDYTLNPAIKKQGAVNQIIIKAKGAALSFIVNDTLLKTITDTSYTSGSVALFVSNLPEAKPVARAQFSHFAIYPLN